MAFGPQGVQKKVKQSSFECIRKHENKLRNEFVAKTT